MENIRERRIVINIGQDINIVCTKEHFAEIYNVIKERYLEKNKSIEKINNKPIEKTENTTEEIKPPVMPRKRMRKYVTINQKKNTSWKDYEIKFLKNNMDKPAKNLSKALKRTVKAVNFMKVQIRKGLK